MQFDIESTILVDDCADKARLQPFNYVPITEYDWNKVQTTLTAVKAFEDNLGYVSEERPLEGKGRAGVSVTSRTKLFQLLFGCSCSNYYDKYISDSGARIPGDVGLKMDAMLLALIGIFAELKDVENVPVWIASGGLKPDVRHNFTTAMASRGWAYIAELDSGMTCAPAPSPDIQDHKYPVTLPCNSEDNHEMWHDSPLHVLYWIRRGLRALDDRGIQPAYGHLGKKKGSW